MDPGRSALSVDGLVEQYGRVIGIVSLGGAAR
jgi:hypothetical protein